MFGGFRCSKYSLLVVSFCLIGIGANLIRSNLVYSLPIIGGVVACGVFLLILSVLGIYATLKHHQVMLFFYMVIMFILFLIQFSIACASLSVSENMQMDLAKKGWSLAGNSTKEDVQNSMKCCGFSSTSMANSSDPFQNHPSCIHIPECTKECPTPTEASCCTDKAPCTCDTCDGVLQAVIGRSFQAAGGLSLFFSFTEFLGVWLTLRYRNLRDPDRSGDTSAFL